MIRSFSFHSLKRISVLLCWKEEVWEKARWRKRRVEKERQDPYAVAGLSKRQCCVRKDPCVCCCFGGRRFGKKRLWRRRRVERERQDLYVVAVVSTRQCCVTGVSVQSLAPGTTKLYRYCKI